MGPLSLSKDGNGYSSLSPVQLGPWHVSLCCPPPNSSASPKMALNPFLPTPLPIRAQKKGSTFSWCLPQARSRFGAKVSTSAQAGLASALFPGLIFSNSGGDERPNKIMLSYVHRASYTLIIGHASEEFPSSSPLSLGLISRLGQFKPPATPPFPLYLNQQGSGCH